MIKYRLNAKLVLNSSFTEYEAKDEDITCDVHVALKTGSDWEKKRKLPYLITPSGIAKYDKYTMCTLIAITR